MILPPYLAPPSSKRETANRVLEKKYRPASFWYIYREKSHGRRRQRKKDKKNRVEKTKQGKGKGETTRQPVSPKGIINLHPKSKGIFVVL